MMMKPEQVTPEAPHADATEGTTSASEVQGVTHSVEDMAAHDYKNLLPELYKIIDFMPKKHLLRVFKAVLEYPLETQHPNLSFDSEKKAFYYGAKIMDCRTVLMKAVMDMINEKHKMEAFKQEHDALLAQKENG